MLRNRLMVMRAEPAPLLDECPLEALSRAQDAEEAAFGRVSLVEDQGGRECPQIDRFKEAA